MATIYLSNVRSGSRDSAQKLVVGRVRNVGILLLEPGRDLRRKIFFRDCIFFEVAVQ